MPRPSLQLKDQLVPFAPDRFTRDRVEDRIARILVDLLQPLRDFAGLVKQPHLLARKHALCLELLNLADDLVLVVFGLRGQRLLRC
jgi:hypothetical protein